MSSLYILAINPLLDRCLQVFMNKLFVEGSVRGESAKLFLKTDLLQTLTSEC